jgi:hypothetical protein
MAKVIFGTCPKCNQPLGWNDVDHITKTTTSAEKEYWEAVRDCADKWVAACGGMEVAAKARNGHRYLYVFNPCKKLHGWYNLDTDMVEKDCPY